MSNDLFVSDDFSGDGINLDVYNIADYPGVSLVDAPARHPGHGSALVTLPWDWQRHQDVFAPASEARIRGRLTYGPSTGNNPIEFGIETWVGVAVHLPAGNEIGYPITLMQFATGRTEPTIPGPPSLALRLMPDNKFMLRLRSAKSASPNDLDLFATDHAAGVATPGKWVDFVFHARFSLSGGFVHGWVNGEKFVEVHGRTIGAVAIEQFLFLKMGLYVPALRENLMTPGTVQRVHLGAFRFGPPGVGFAGVDPANWPGDQVDREAMRKWLTEADDLIPQLDAWLARGKTMLG